MSGLPVFPAVSRGAAAAQHSLDDPPPGPFPDRQTGVGSLPPSNPALFEELGWDPEKRWFI